MIFGVLAFALTALVWRAFQGGDERLLAASNAPLSPAQGGAGGHGRGEMALLTLAHGLAGFGYIITATFLPVIARTALPGSAWLDLFWPIFGLA